MSVNVQNHPDQPPRGHIGIPYVYTQYNGAECSLFNPLSVSLIVILVLLVLFYLYHKRYIHKALGAINSFVNTAVDKTKAVGSNIHSKTVKSYRSGRAARTPAPPLPAPPLPASEFSELVNTSSSTSPGPLGAATSLSSDLEFSSP
jgi:hypothetical protein